MKTMIDHYHEELNRGNPETWRLLKERALESTAEGVVISDCTQPDMPVIYVNNAFTEITGYTYDEVVGKNCRFLQGKEANSAAAQEIRKAISAQQPCKVEILNYRKDGTTFWNRLSITPVRDEDGQVTHFIGIQSDVTRRRKAESSLRNINAQLNRDLQAAATVQQALLPKALPETNGFRFGWRYRPCQELAG
ncbi:MAG: PAS domain-containing protein, partial [Planctomycetota bacterium]